MKRKNLNPFNLRPSGFMGITSSVIMETDRFMLREWVRVEIENLICRIRTFLFLQKRSWICMFGNESILIIHNEKKGRFQMSAIKMIKSKNGDMLPVVKDKDLE